MNWKTLAVAALIGFGLWQHLQNRPVNPGPGVVAAAEPQQAETASDVFAFKGYTLLPLQDFSIEARIPDFQFLGYFFLLLQLTVVLPNL